MNARPYHIFFPLWDASGTGSRHLRQRRLRTANLIKRRIADRSQVRFETEELRVAGASFFVVDARTEHAFFARDSATSQKSHSTSVTLPSRALENPKLPSSTTLPMPC